MTHAVLALSAPNQVVGWIAYIIIGAIAGWLAGRLIGGDDGSLVVDVIVGVIGGFIGGWLLQKFDVHLWGEGHPWWITFITALIGAIILLIIVRLIRRFI